MADEERKKNAESDAFTKAAIAGAATDTVQRYGGAVKEHIVAYSGVDNAAGTRLRRSLKDIYGYNVDPANAASNLKQQAGFVAEIKDSARTNAEASIKGSPVRKIRTDDIGRVNDQLYDHVLLDANGNVIPGSGTQMKFIGKDGADAYSKLKTKQFDKYFDADVKIEVPSDRYSDILKAADADIAKLKGQLEKASGTEAEKIKSSLNRAEKIKKNLVKSKVSSSEAMEARMHPALSTAKDIAHTAHRAGAEAAGVGAAVGGGISVVRNLVLAVKGEKEPEEAVADVAVDTVKSAATAYGTTTISTALTGAMKNSASASVQTLAKTNIAGTAVMAATEAVAVMKRFYDGEIDGVECLEELGERGVGMLSSSMFAVLGQMAIPIPVVGGLIGSMLGYAVSSASYGLLLSTLKEAKLAHEQRLAVERECEEHIKLIREYRRELEDIISRYLVSYMEDFRSSFDGIKASMSIGDIDGFISYANGITRSLGGEVLFESFDEFNSIMNDKETTIKI